MKRQVCDATEPHSLQVIHRLCCVHSNSYLLLGGTTTTPCPHEQMCTLIITYVKEYGGGGGYHLVADKTSEIERICCIPFKSLDGISMRQSSKSDVLVMSQTTKGGGYMEYRLSARDLKTRQAVVNDYVSFKVFNINDMSRTGLSLWGNML